MFEPGLRIGRKMKPNISFTMTWKLFDSKGKSGGFNRIKYSSVFVDLTPEIQAVAVWLKEYYF
jgi:hypothetical protein